MSAALKLYQAAESGAGQPGARKRWRMAAQALALVTDDADGQKAFAVATESHKRADWRMAARTLAKALGAPEKRPSVAVKPERAPMTLCEFLSRAGGLRDTGGDLQAMGAHLWHRRGAFRRKLVTDTGLALDYAADLACERGYVSGYASPSLGMGADRDDELHRLGVGALLEAIEREIAGTPCYPAESDWAPYVEPEPEDHEALYAETWPESVDDWAMSYGEAA
jgi:hypothetical protein